MRRGIPRVPAASATTVIASSTLACPDCPPSPLPPPPPSPAAPGLTPLVPLFAALAIIALLTPLLYSVFSRAPSLLSLVPLLRSSGASSSTTGTPEDLHLALSSLVGYRSAQTSSLATKRSSFRHLAGRQRALARELAYPERQERVRQAGEVNAAFLEALAGLARRETGALGRSWSRTKGGRGDQGRVHEMIKQFFLPLHSHQVCLEPRC
jgi:hypothetical protein